MVARPLTMTTWRPWSMAYSSTQASLQIGHESDHAIQHQTDAEDGGHQHDDGPTSADVALLKLLDLRLAERQGGGMPSGGVGDMAVPCRGGGDGFVAHGGF